MEANLGRAIYLIAPDPGVLAAAQYVAREKNLELVECKSIEEYLASDHLHQARCAIADANHCVSLDHPFVMEPQSLPMIVVTEESNITCAVCAASSGHLVLMKKPIIIQQLATYVDLLLARDEQLRQSRQVAKELETKLATLTRRENEVMCLLAKGRSTKQIAKSLEISPKTVEIHRCHVLQKLEMESPSELASQVAPLLENQLVSPLTTNSLPNLTQLQIADAAILD